jgi:DNA-binding NarL/FixJ family response regulator
MLDRVERICRRDLDDRALRGALLAELRASIPFDRYAWLLTDPETTVGSSPLAETPSMADLPALIRSKYLTPVNRWTSLDTNEPVTLLETTGGDRTRSRIWGELLAGYGVDDVLSAVFRDQYGCWGFLDLWRVDGPFTSSDRSLLADVVRIATPALRRCLARTFETDAPELGSHDAPVVLLLSEDLQILTHTPNTDAYLRALLPTDSHRAPVPACAYNVSAQLLAQEQGIDGHAPSARVHLHGGLWVTLRAARLVDREPGGASIAVSMEPTPPIERAALYARVVGFSDRERELLHHLAGGSDTREAASRMFVSENTVQDHLKSMFAKSCTRSRRVLITRATGAG